MTGLPTTKGPISVTTLVVLFVGIGLLTSLAGVIALAANGVEIPDALKTYIVGSVGMLGGILVPTAQAGSTVVTAPDPIVEGNGDGLA